MFDKNALFDDGDTAITTTGYGAGSALNTGPGTYTIEAVMTSFNNTAGTDVIKVQESQDGVTYNDLAVFETFGDVGVKARLNVTTKKEYLKLHHTLTTVTSLKCVAGIVAAHGGAV